MKALSIRIVAIGSCVLFCLSAAFVVLSSSVPSEIDTSKYHPTIFIPDPAPLALFGSGLFGMVFGFFRRTYALTKRTIDVAGSIIALVLLSPVVLLVAGLFALFWLLK